MIFESKYRRQAMQLWEQSREEAKKELVEDFTSYQKKFIAFHHRLREVIALLFRPNKRSSP